MLLKDRDQVSEGYMLNSQGNSDSLVKRSYTPASWNQQKQVFCILSLAMISPTQNKEDVLQVGLVSSVPGIEIGSQF